MRAKIKAVQVDTKSKFEETKSNDELWDQIGFHRPLGGLLYNLTLIVLTILFGVVINLYILPRWVYPFPETLGWQDMTNQIFYLTFVIADLGIGAALQRFIGEIAVKEPRKSLHYIRFFIWFQMFTGLLQITGITAWVLYGGVTEGDLAYASWFFLLHSTIQYPGMLHIFSSVLSTLQQYNKTAWLGFIQGEVFQRLTEIGFVLWGKHYGETHPEVGALMGIALGSAFSCRCLMFM